MARAGGEARENTILIARANAQHYMLITWPCVQAEADYATGKWRMRRIAVALLCGCVTLRAVSRVVLYAALSHTVNVIFRLLAQPITLLGTFLKINATIKRDASLHSMASTTKLGGGGQASAARAALIWRY